MFLDIYTIRIKRFHLETVKFASFTNNYIQYKAKLSCIELERDWDGTVTELERD